MAFIEKGITPPKDFTVQSTVKKPNALINAQTIYGNPNRFIKYAPQVQQSTIYQISYAADKYKLFDYYTFDKDQVNNEDTIFNRDNSSTKKEIDYTVDMVVFLDYDKNWVDWIPITRLFSLGLIPVYNTTETLVTLKIYDKNNQLISSTQNSALMKLWTSWWVLPLSFTNNPFLH